MVIRHVVITVAQASATARRTTGSKANPQRTSAAAARAADLGQVVAVGAPKVPAARAAKGTRAPAVGAQERVATRRADGSKSKPKRARAAARSAAGLDPAPSGAESGAHEAVAFPSLGPDRVTGKRTKAHPVNLLIYLEQAPG